MPPKKSSSSMWAKAKTAAAMSSAAGSASASSSSSSKKAPGPASLNKGKAPAASSSAASSLPPPAQYHPLSSSVVPTEESLSNMDPLERAVMSILAINPVGLSVNAFDNDFTQRLRKFNEAVHDAVRNSTSQLDAKMLKVKTRTEKKENEAKAVARPVLALRKTQQKLLASRNYSDAWDQMKEIRRAEKDAVAAYRAQARPEMEAELNAVQEEREVVEAQLKARINTAEERIRAFRQECITQIHLDHGLPPPPPQQQPQQQPQQRPQPQPPRPQPLQPPPPQQSGSADDPNSPPIEIIPSPEFHVPNSVAYYPQAHYHAPQAPHHHTAVGSAVASMMMHTPPALLSRPLVPEAAAHVDPTVPPPALFQTTPAPYTGTFAGQVPMRPLPPAWQPNASSSMPMASPWIGNSGMNNNVQSAAEALMSAASMLLGRTTPFPSSYAPISPAPTPASSQGVYNARAARAASTTPAPPSALKQHSAPAPAPATAAASAAPPSSSPSKAAGRGSAFAHNSSDSDFDEDDVPLTTPTRTSTKPSNRDDVPGITLSNLPKPNISAADRKREAAQKEDGAKAGWSRAGNFVRSQAMPALRSLNAAAKDARDRRDLEDSDRAQPENGPTEKQRAAAKLLMGAAGKAGAAPSAAAGGGGGGGGGRLAAALSRARAQKPETLPEAPTANNNSAATNSSSSFSGVVAAQKAAQKLRSDAAKKRLFTTEDFKQLFSNCRHGRKEAVVKLLENGCPVDGRDSFGNTPLIVACQNGQARIVKACLRHNANPDAQNKQGNTALHYCVAYGFSALGDYLISKGARDDIKNRAGLTPYEGIGFK